MAWSFDLTIHLSLPFLCHTLPLLFFLVGVVYVSPMFCYSHHQQQGQQMSMAIGFFPLNGPPLTQQWNCLSMRHAHSHTQRGLYSVAGAATSPTICPISSGMLLSSLAMDRNEERIDRSMRWGEIGAWVKERVSPSRSRQVHVRESARKRERREDVVR